jgi:hypothetical protein
MPTERKVFGKDLVASLLVYANILPIDLIVKQSNSMQSKIIISLTQVGFYTILGWQIAISVTANNLPPDSDIPEEVLRGEIITEGRSPISGKALSANDFAEFVVNTKQQLDRDDAISATSNPKFKETLFLLRLRGFLRSVGVPIK